MNIVQDLQQYKKTYSGSDTESRPTFISQRNIFVNSDMSGDGPNSGILNMPEGPEVFGFLADFDSYENRAAAVFLSNDIVFYSANDMSLSFASVLDYDNDSDTSEYKVTYRNGEGETSKEQEYFDNRDDNTLAGPVLMAVSTTGMAFSSAKEEKILSLISDIVIPNKSEVNFTTNPLNQTLRKNILFSTESVLGAQSNESGFDVTITEGTEIETSAPTASTTDLTTSTGTGTASPSAGTAISGYGGRSATVGSSGGGGSYS